MISRNLFGAALLLVFSVLGPQAGWSQAAKGMATSHRQQHSHFPVVPYPASLAPGAGQFLLSGNTTVATSDPADQELGELARYCVDMLTGAVGTGLSVSSARAGDGAGDAIVLRLAADAGVGPEGYSLEVSPRNIIVSAQTHAGVFHGIQTLRQLVNEAISGDGEPVSLAISAVQVEDSPRFAYRGMHLDVGRHFFPVEFVKKYIDLLALYKMNTFHWHLTEDQGWRIEIKKYPLLTSVGAYRKETILAKNFRPYVGDRKPYGGYYTQAEVREVVEYARSRYITVIPEIEMPGHSSAALAAYPELACAEGPFQVATVWGIHEDIYCPSEATFQFLQDVLTEVMELFPGQYIHIGGDEAPKRRWEESELAQQLIRDEGLADEHELQSYFVRRIEKFLLENDRRLIGWDEILEGGLAPQATVMSWRGTTGGIEAAKQGHDVIMTPTSHVYFDYYQGDPFYEPLAIGGYTPLEKVYAFEPVPEELTPEEAKHILGAQANVWTEYMKTPQYVEYMVFPRMLALSEVVWSPQDARDWDRFVAALPAQFRLLDTQRVNYRVPHVRGLEGDRITLDDRVTVSLTTLIPEAQIRYTIDGSEPNRASPLYTEPLDLAVDEKGVRVAARAFVPPGRVSATRAARFSKSRLRSPVQVDESELEPGLRFAYYEAQVASVRELSAYDAVRDGVAPRIAHLGFERAEDFGLEFTGYVHIPESGIYTFHLTSDDGSELAIGNEVVIDHDGYHGATEKAGMVALAAGYHAVTVRYFQAGGGSELALVVAADGEEEPRPLAGWLFHGR